jgi:hypothetical protein
MEVVMGRRFALLAVVFVVFSVSTQFIGAQTPPSLQGAWRVLSVVVTGDGASANKSPQPGIFIFTKQHYSIVMLNGTAPRKNFANPANPDKLTDAEKIARFTAWDELTANSGTYEIKGNVLTTHPVVAKNPAVMGVAQTRDVKITGNTLTLVQKSPAGQPASTSTTTLTRIE